MADESSIQIPDEVRESDNVTWKPVKQLADAISQLYVDKKIFIMTEGEGGGVDAEVSADGDNKISDKSMRITDTHACVCTNSSTSTGSVYLSTDVTAPFRFEKLGDSEAEIEDKILAFEFVYDPKKYKEYLNGETLPVLTTQYLFYYKDVVQNDQEKITEHMVFRSDDLTEEIASAITNNNKIATNNIIESDRSQLKKFWDKGKVYSENKQIAGELYLLVNSLDGSDCCHITRVAFAGLNNNGNGNSCPEGGTEPAPWIEGGEDGNKYIGADINYFLQKSKSPWMSADPVALTLTGVSLDRKSESNAKYDSVTASKKGFLPETPDLPEKDATYTPPPIGCSVEFMWPTIGVEGGGKNSFYSKSLFKKYTDWADWRDKYREPLSEASILSAEANKPNVESIPDDMHFPCYLGKDRSSKLASSYEYLFTKKNVDVVYQRWVKINDTEYVRIVPMEFESDSPSEKAYLAVPVTVVRILKPRSYQTAIRTRWYEMMYYSLRNIAGYKYYNETTGAYTIVGVTWDPEKVTYDKCLNPCVDKREAGLIPGEPGKMTCYCDYSKYERWKILGLGGETSDTPFVGTRDMFSNYNTEKKINAAQLWQWNEGRDSTLTTELAKAGEYNLFPELYFEKLLCYYRDDVVAEKGKKGGFENPSLQDSVFECTACTDEITLPWDGGHNNESCETEGADESPKKTHAYTFNKLRYLAKYIADNKLPEDMPMPMKYLEIGECHCYATAGASAGITYTDVSASVGKPISSSAGDAVPCTNVTNESFILPLIPSYYETLSKNEEAYIGAAETIMIETSIGSYGYNAYIWKAFDPGGLRDEQDSAANITIEFTHYSPAKLCGTSTLPPVTDGLVTNNCTPNCAAPLYMYNNMTYSLGGNTSISATTGANRPKSITAVEENHKDATTGQPSTDKWAEIMLIASDTERYTDRTMVCDVPLWYRDNQDTSIGEIDIYVAPAPDSNDMNSAKYLGTCKFKMNRQTSPNVDYHHCTYGMPTCNGCIAVGNEAVANQEIDGTAGSEVNTSNMITINVTHQPEGEGIEDTNYMSAKIQIPKSILRNNTGTGTTESDVYTDRRQQFIVLAARASHTHINSWLAADSGTVSLNTPSKNLKTWVTQYAAACRYADFRLSYKFTQEGSDTQ